MADAKAERLQEKKSRERREIWWPVSSARTCLPGFVHSFCDLACGYAGKIFFYVNVTLTVI